MDHRETTYREFKIEVDRGLQEIAKIDARSLMNIDRNREVNIACAGAIDRLLETEIGRRLGNDDDLERVNLNLEEGLKTVVNELRKKKSTEILRSAIAWGDQCCDERKLKFLGGIGRIFYYFRDRPTSLDTRQEALMRKELSAAAIGFVDKADALLFHITPELMYDDDVVAMIRRLSEGMLELQARLIHPPIDSDTGPNPFHDGGKTIIVRQFTQAVSLLGFELYGWVNPKLLTALLEMKASTADAYGLSHWLIDAGGSYVDRERKLRKFISEALLIAKTKAIRSEWRTRKMIEFYSRSRKRFTEDDGLVKH